MAVKLIANYAKRLGLPGFSSHQFSVSVETELHDVENVAGESQRLYEVLQQSVDEQIRNSGFVPADKNGHTNGNGEPVPHNGNNGAGISEKQLDLIARVVRENNANKTEVENMAVEMFGGSVRTLNRMQASNFIDALFQKYPRRNGNGQRSAFPRQEARAS